MSEICIYAFIRAGMLEELAAQLLPLIVQRWRARRRFLVANVLTALSGGVVYIGLALYTRSLWPAMMTRIYDLFVFWGMLWM
ncbi:MAG: hypothetical protein EOP24_38305 [Hyphomicrobiales bacterium]|nr:MAG: hypothetical protein EOP24_38305 [Hyphomicrobiales bacterium]